MKREEPAAEMIVCHCRGVTDRQIKRVVRDGACSAREVARATGAGLGCGGCRSVVKQVVGRAAEREAERSASPGFLEIELDLGIPAEG